MKFCKVLQSQADSIPHHLFLRYKDMKKQIKSMTHISPSLSADGDAAVSSGCSAGSAGATLALRVEDVELLAAISQDVDNFNSFFMDKEEDAVIKLCSLSEELQTATSSSKVLETMSQLVNLHGELVLVLHWSLLNYDAIAKILKKYDKHTGESLRSPYLAAVLQQPFASTNVINDLIKRAESLISLASSMSSTSAGQPATPPMEKLPSSIDLNNAARSSDSFDVECHTSTTMTRPTIAALEAWRSLAMTASTPSTIFAIECLPSKARQELSLAADRLRHTC